MTHPSTRTMPLTPSVEASQSTHSIRLNVLGIAGITVDRARCRDVVKRKEAPTPPDQLSAVVTVSHGKTIDGMTKLSKRLIPSPKSDVVVSSDSVGDDERSSTTEKSVSNRHVAVWAGNRGTKSLGSKISFEVNLERFDSGEDDTVSPQHLPLSFQLTVGLTGGALNESEIALPIGVANLTISSQLSQNGGVMVLDLPILPLEQANPVGFNGKGLMDLLPIREGSGSTKKERKRSSLRNFFGKKGSSKQRKAPSIAERVAFSKVYSIDATGDAILRIQLQVKDRNPGNPSTTSESSMKMSASSRNSLTTFDYDSLKSSLGTASTESAGSSATFLSSTSTFYTSSTFQNSKATNGSRTRRSSGSSRVADSLAFERDENTFESCHTNSIHDSASKPTQSESSRNVKYSPPCFMESGNAHESSHKRSENLGHLAPKLIKVFGKEINIPSCGPLVTSEKKYGSEDHFSDDELTHITGDFFGRDFHIPICPGMKTRYDDESLTFLSSDSFSTYSFESSIVRRKNIIMKKRSEEALRRGKETVSVEDLNYPDTVPANVDGALCSSCSKVKCQCDTEPRPKNRKPDGKNYRQNEGSSPEPVNHSKGPTRLPLIQPDFVPAAMPKTRVYTFEDVESARLVDHEPPPAQSLRLRPKLVPSKKNGENSGMRCAESSFAGMFQCGYSSDGSQETRLTTKTSEVPGVVVPSDVSTLGDLTAITHELKIDKKTRPPVSRSMPLPIALGGRGMCSNMRLVDHIDTEVELDLNKSQSVFSGRSRSMEENYFADYDELSSFRPERVM